MKYIIPFALFTLSSILSFGQNNYDDLLELVVDEKYERCLYKAVRYTEDDRTKKDPLPYLYMSMSYFRIHQGDDEKVKEKFPKAFKESLKYVVKHRKKDKENEYFAEFQDYFSELRLETMSEAEREVDNEKFTRSKGLYKYLVSLDESDPGAYLAYAHSLWMMKSRKDATLAWEEAKKILNEQGVDHLSEDQLQLLKQSVIQTSEMLDEQGDRSAAKEWLEMTKTYFEEDPEFGVTYSTIVG